MLYLDVLYTIFLIIVLLSCLRRSKKASLATEKENSYDTVKLEVFRNLSIYSFHIVENIATAVCLPRKESWTWETTNSEYGKFYIRKNQREVMFCNHTRECRVHLI